MRAVYFSVREMRDQPIIFVCLRETQTPTGSSSSHILRCKFSKMFASNSLFILKFEVHRSWGSVPLVLGIPLVSHYTGDSQWWERHLSRVYRLRRPQTTRARGLVWRRLKTFLEADGGRDGGSQGNLSTDEAFQRATSPSATLICSNQPRVCTV